MSYSSVVVASGDKNFLGLDTNGKVTLPKNFTLPNTDDEKQTLAKVFMSEFEKFVHTYMASTKNEHTPVTIKKPNEDGEFDEVILHSSKFEAWYRLEKDLKKSIKNKASKIYKYTDVFNSKSIEKTISRGTFLLSSNNSPIFNQGLLNSDEEYRVHVKDELYEFGSFILELYGERLAIQDNIQSIFKSLSKDCQNKYGFNINLELNEIKNQNKLLTVLDAIINRIQPITEYIKELENSIKNMIFGRDSTVGIDNFQWAWEELFIGAFKRYYGDGSLFNEDEVSLDFRNLGDREIIKPDAILIRNQNEKHIMHIFDLKYKKNNYLTVDNLDSSGKCEDWIKQIIYIENFLNPEINCFENNVQVDDQIYFIVTGMENTVQEFRRYNHNIFLIELDVIELLKIYNNSISENSLPHNETIKILDELIVNVKGLYPHKRYKPYIPECCYSDHNLQTSSYSGYSDNGNRYLSYKKHLFESDNHMHFTDNFFATKTLRKIQGQWNWS